MLSSRKAANDMMGTFDSFTAGRNAPKFAKNVLCSRGVTPQTTWCS